MYIYDISKLLPGDILLERYPDDRMSETICKKSGSNYSHARLYVGDCSVVEAGDTVEANNPARTLIEDPTSACVLRLKPDLFSEEVINEAITSVRRKVFTEYSWDEAKKIINNKEPNALKPNRQTCTRLIAQAYLDAGIKLVNNADYCTTKELEESDCLQKIDHVLKEATQIDIDFANSPSVLEEQSRVQRHMIRDINKRLNADLQSIEQITNYVLAHPADANGIVDIMREAGYFEMWKLEEELNPQNYDALLLKQYYGENLNAAVNEILENNENQVSLYFFNKSQIGFLARCYGDNSYFIVMSKLYDNLIEQCHRREEVARQAVNLSQE